MNSSSLHLIDRAALPPHLVEAVCPEPRIRYQDESEGDPVQDLTFGGSVVRLTASQEDLDRAHIIL